MIKKSGKVQYIINPTAGRNNTGEEDGVRTEFSHRCPEGFHEAAVFRGGDVTLVIDAIAREISECFNITTIQQILQIQITINLHNAIEFFVKRHIFIDCKDKTFILNIKKLVRYFRCG